MGLFNLEKLFGMTIRESATDGSDFTNPDADYRRLFLGEDGQLHVKDSAGAVTDIGGAVSEITDIATAEMDDTLVLAPDGTGGVEFRAEAGGTGALPYPDTVPASPHASDDEFIQNTSGTPAGWTSWNTPSAIDTDTRPGWLHILDTAAGSDHWRGCYKAIPATPFTVTAKIASQQGYDYALASLVLIDSGPTKFIHIGTGTAGAVSEYWNSVTSKNSDIASKTNYWGPLWVRWTVTDTTHVDGYISRDGLVYHKLITAYAVGFTIANVGLGVNSAGSNSNGEACIDYIRFE
jgi:hypothetical protein